ncbi:hypothetical protein H5410_014879 [Solanum commersonii]|uniref:Uncharacterized protein n=1 Tax=Solanum commersonii TaxID=4109 RepID=A0A9J5ZSS2_SOLCO|nr:hypothetical protein H5410_014879 [Solanum commersonii]
MISRRFITLKGFCWNRVYQVVLIPEYSHYAKSADCGKGRRTDRNKSACTAEENSRLAKGITIIIANAGRRTS